MFSEINTMLTSVTAMRNFTQFVLQSKVDNAVREKAIEFQSDVILLQSSIMSLQSDYQKLFEENEALKNRLREADNWSAEADKYELAALSPGIFVYSLRASEDGNAVTHWLCTNCFEQREKSILQNEGNHIGGGTIYRCPRCKYDIDVPSRANYGQRNESDFY